MATKLIPVLKWMLRIMKTLGAFCEKRNMLSYITMISLAMVCLLMMIDVTVFWTGIESLRKITFLPGFFVTAIKAIFMIYNSPQLIKIVDSLQYFWNPDVFHEDVAKKYHRTFKIITLICAGYSVSGYIICFGLVATGILGFPERTLIYSDFGFCNLQSIPCWISMLIWQTVALLLQIVPAAISFDAIFIIFIGYVISACDLLDVQLESLNTSNINLRKCRLKHIVQQHDFIMHFIKELNRLFSIVMLMQFWCSLWSMILFLNMMISNGIPPSFSDVSLLGSLYLIVIFQIFLYSSGGALLEGRVKSLSNDMYNVNWYGKERTDFRKDLSFMILRANKTKILSAGKMSELNLGLFIVTVKNSFSVFTLLLQLSEQAIKL